MKFDNKICLGLLEIGDLGPLLLISASRPHSGRKHLQLQAALWVIKAPCFMLYE